MLHILLYKSQLKWTLGANDSFRYPTNPSQADIIKLTGPKLQAAGIVDKEHKKSVMSAVRSIKVSTGSVHVSTSKYLSLGSSCFRIKQEADQTGLSLASLAVGKDPAGRKGFEEAETSSGRGESSSAERPVFE